MYRKLFFVLIILAFATIACNFNINLPVNSITPGPTVTDDISVAQPGGTGPVNLKLAFGAGTLKLNPGSSSMVSGTATYNIADFKPEISTNGNSVRIEQGNWKMTGIPNLNNIKNDWDLSLGNSPMNLTVEAGAYKAEYQFGGLALTNLTIRDGASESEVDFDSANTAEMALLRYETGASSVTLTGLGNANFASLEFDCGAGDYTLDFGGSLQRAGSVHIQTGVSDMTLVIPSGIPVQVTVQGALANVTHGSGWTQNGKVYTQDGTGPGLTITVEIGAGNLTLTD
jgi:hypothetical protein